MRRVSVLAGLAVASLLTACSPAASSDADEKSFRAEAAVAAEPSEDKLPPVLDAEGNELDPQLADAVRAKMDEDNAAAEEAAQADAVSDNSAPAADDAT